MGKGSLTIPGDSTVEVESDNLRREIKRLRELYQGFPLEPAIWRRDGHRRSPYRVLMVMGLSLKAKDHTDYIIWHSFLSKYPSSPMLTQELKRDRQSVFNSVRCLGMREHVRRIIDAASTFGPRIPSTENELQKLPGIGPVLADKVIGYGFGKPALPLDSNVRDEAARVCNPSSKHYQDWRSILKASFDSSEWMEVHELLRLHSQITTSNSTPQQVYASWNKWRSLLLED